MDCILDRVEDEDETSEEFHQNKRLEKLEDSLRIQQINVAFTYEKIAHLRRELKDLEGAHLAFSQALAIHQSFDDDQDDIAIASLCQELGNILGVRTLDGNEGLCYCDQAIHFYSDALKIKKELSEGDTDDQSLADIYYGIGMAWLELDEMDRAIPCLEEALRIQRIHLNAQDQQLGDILNDLGHAHKAIGDFDKALPFLWEALVIRRTNKDSLKTSHTLIAIGYIHREKDEFEKARKCYQDSCRSLRQGLGENNEPLADALVLLGNVLRDMDLLEKAMESYKHAFKIRSALHGKRHQSVTTILENMGGIYLRQNEYRKAHQILREFTNIRDETNIEPDCDYVNVLIMLGKIHQEWNEDSEAIAYFKRANVIFNQLGLAEDNPQLAKTMAKMTKQPRRLSFGSLSNLKQFIKKPMKSPKNGKERSNNSTETEKMSTDDRSVASNGGKNGPNNRKQVPVSNNRRVSDLGLKSPTKAKENIRRGSLPLMGSDHKRKEDDFRSMPFTNNKTPEGAITDLTQDDRSSDDGGASIYKPGIFRLDKKLQQLTGKKATTKKQIASHDSVTTSTAPMDDSFVFNSPIKSVGTRSYTESVDIAISNIIVPEE